MAIKLYGGAMLLDKANQSSVIQHLNNAPGGIGGVDGDIQEKLGAPGLENKGLQMVDRRHGICCGITLSWMIGFCNSVQGAQSCKYFQSYFQNNLRFQGAYFKAEKGNVSAIDALANSGYAHGCVKISGKKEMATFDFDNFGSNLPDKYAMYLSIWHHAIGIGITQGRFYIMDPNAGLFAYWSKEDFLYDLNELILARRVAKNLDFSKTISAYPYTKQDDNMVYL